MSLEKILYRAEASATAAVTAVRPAMIAIWTCN